MGGGKEYSPLPKEAIENILRRWNLYRRTIGLEGDLYLELMSQKKDPVVIERTMEEHKNVREQLLKLFHKEIGLKRDGN